MGVLLSLPFTLLNALLPFTKPGTPIFQDLVHTGILCGTLYFAPQIAEWYNAQRAQGTAVEGVQEARQPREETEDGDVPQPEEPPLDERLVLQDDGEEAIPGPPPPLAPTPPPHHHQPHAPLVEDFPEDAPNGNAFLNDVAGPANPNNPRPTPANRTIGAKKAKSLARKDQRRAYHEFHRQEAELRRLQEAEGATEREAILTAERERRARIEEEIREKEREERDKVKKEREREADEENMRRERVILAVREGIHGLGAVDLVNEAWKEGKDRVWIERVVRASGLLGQVQRDGSHAMITTQGWFVKIDAELMEKAYAAAVSFGDQQDGKVSFSDFGSILETVIMARTKA